jgi:putative ABC transport system permease protein
LSAFYFARVPNPVLDCGFLIFDFGSAIKGDAMFKNYLTIALRILRRNKVIAFINIAGLAVGMVCAALILLFVRHELSYDQYHLNKKSIYRLVTGVQGAAYQAIAKVPGAWGIAAERDLPEVRNAARFVFFNETLVSRGEKRFYETGGFYADSSVFEVFSFPLIKGNPKTALRRPNTIVVTKDFAERYFGEEDALGQTLTFDAQNEFQITGVLSNVPSNSHFTFDFLVSMATYSNPRRDDWQWNQYYTYLLLNDGASPEAVAAKFPALLRTHIDEKLAADYAPSLQPLTDIHLHSNLFREMQTNSDITYVYMVSAVGFFILLIACINFMNLTTARATTRAKEVGVRKVSGAGRLHLIKQFLSESILTSLVAAVIAVVGIDLLLPVFNSLTGRQLGFDYLNEKTFLFGFFGLAAIIGIFSGSYPAFVLSSFKPSSTLKGKSGGGRGAWLRKTLVVTQFAISAILMIATGIIYNQLEFIQNKKLGFNEEQLVILRIRDDAMREKYETVKRELLQHPSIVSVAASGNLPGGGDWGIPYEPEGIPQDRVPPMRELVVDHDFIQTFEIELAAGRTFSRDHPTDAAAYLINEEAARQLGWSEPLGKMISMPNIQREKAPVIGVLKDFHFRSMREKISPIMFFIPPPDWFNIISVRIRPENVSQTLAFIESKWNEFDPNHPFAYTFFDEDFARLHRTEEQMAKLLGYVAILAIFIACMGLFGLAAFTAEQRTKEIGVRKVLGASVGSIVALLSKDFTRLALAGFAVAAPLAYYAMHRWLENFAYRIEIGAGVFIAVGMLALIIAWLTVSFQSIKAAVANPVEALRYE